MVVYTKNISTIKLLFCTLLSKVLKENETNHHDDVQCRMEARRIMVANRHKQANDRQMLSII